MYSLQINETAEREREREKTERLVLFNDALLNTQQAWLWLTNMLFNAAISHFSTLDKADVSHRILDSYCLKGGLKLVISLCFRQVVVSEIDLYSCFYKVESTIVFWGILNHLDQSFIQWDITLVLIKVGWAVLSFILQNTSRHFPALLPSFSLKTYFLSINNE